MSVGGPGPRTRWRFRRKEGTSRTNETAWKFAISVPCRQGEIIFRCSLFGSESGAEWMELRLA